MFPPAPALASPTMTLMDPEPTIDVPVPTIRPPLLPADATPEPTVTDPDC